MGQGLTQVEDNSMNIGSLNIPRFILDGEAACVTIDPEIFFPRELEVFAGTERLVSKYDNLPLAKKICDSCPLKNPCLEYALRNVEVGVWGGTTEHQREDLRKAARVRAVRRPNTPLYR
jgi:WhiB family transcriptional regulator, redox-sensing transcriptional regulator